MFSKSKASIARKDDGNDMSIRRSTLASHKSPLSLDSVSSSQPPRGNKNQPSTRVSLRNRHDNDNNDPLTEIPKNFERRQLDYPKDHGFGGSRNAQTFNENLMSFADYFKRIRRELQELVTADPIVSLQDL
eukprot:GILJ01006132.1.p1 GENE.GILJ01006132.1~~GILJ01006132.1.p1  ORF type:complete len:131 (+),score=15.56 GILJ01006132.1:234-626(+)